jgi:hypothetical protein
VGHARRRGHSLQGLEGALRVGLHLRAGAAAARERLVSPRAGRCGRPGFLNPSRCHVERFWFLPGGITEISEPDLPQRVSIEPVTCPWQIEAK